MLEILIYLFENYMGKDTRLDLEETALSSELSQAGYRQHEIDSALKWLDALNQPLIKKIGEKTTRAYHPVEWQCLGQDGIQLLTDFVKLGILTAEMRELVIDRALALGHYGLEPRKLKWIVLMVIFGHSKDQNALIWMQDFVFNQKQAVH